MDRNILYQGCPSLAIKDIKDYSIVNETIEKSMDKRRFVVKDDNGAIVCLVRFVKQEKPVVGLPSYEIVVYNKDYEQMFTKQTDSKKWDWSLKHAAHDVVNDVSHLYELQTSGLIADINNHYKEIVAKSINDSLDWVKSLSETDIDSSLEIKEWYMAPSEKDFTDNDVKWYYELYGGVNQIKKAVSKTLVEKGFKFRADTTWRDYTLQVSEILMLTPVGVMNNMSESVYDCCIDKAIDSIKAHISSLETIDDLDHLVDTDFKQDWGRLAIERLGGKRRVVSELVKPKVREIAEKEIQSINEIIADLESEIADNRAKIEKYQEYLS